MALIEEDNTCSICEDARVITGASGFPGYFCARCYNEHREDILQNVPWVNYVVNGEKQRRKRRNGLFTARINLFPVYLGLNLEGFLCRPLTL